VRRLLPKNISSFAGLCANYSPHSSDFNNHLHLLFFRAVHITKATRSYLEDDFECVAVPRENVATDEVLANHDDLATFLIWPDRRRQLLITPVAEA
jgi:hypothetical protein